MLCARGASTGAGVACSLGLNSTHSPSTPRRRGRTRMAISRFMGGLVSLEWIIRVARLEYAYSVLPRARSGAVIPHEGLAPSSAQVAEMGEAPGRSGRRIL